MDVACSISALSFESWGSALIFSRPPRPAGGPFLWKQLVLRSPPAIGRRFAPQCSCVGLGNPPVLCTHLAAMLDLACAAPVAVETLLFLLEAQQAAAIQHGVQLALPAGAQLPSGASIYVPWAVRGCSRNSGYIPATAQVFLTPYRPPVSGVDRSGTVPPLLFILDRPPVVLTECLSWDGPPVCFFLPVCFFPPSSSRPGLQHGGLNTELLLTWTASRGQFVYTGPASQLCNPWRPAAQPKRKRTPGGGGGRSQPTRRKAQKRRSLSQNGLSQNGYGACNRPLHSAQWVLRGRRVGTGDRHALLGTQVAQHGVTPIRPAMGGHSRATAAAACTPGPRCDGRAATCYESAGRTRLFSQCELRKSSASQRAAPLRTRARFRPGRIRLSRAKVLPPAHEAERGVEMLAQHLESWLQIEKPEARAKVQLRVVTQKAKPKHSNLRREQGMRHSSRLLVVSRKPSLEGPVVPEAKPLSQFGGG